MLMKKENGITLVALVVTIVLIIIIAGVSFNTLFGEEGIITKTRVADLQNDFGIVTDAVKVELIQFKTMKLADHLTQSSVEYLEEKNYIDDDYIVQVQNLTTVKLKTGNGSLEEGDIYKIQGQELVYIDKNGNTIFLASLGDIGELPIRMYFNSNVSASDFMLSLDKKTDSFSIEVSNKKDKITKNDIKYEIEIKPETEDQEMIFDIEINGVTSPNNTISGILTGRVESTANYNLMFKLKEGKKATDLTTLRVIVKTTEPLESEETFLLHVNNDNLIDYSANRYNAKLKGGTKIIKDEQGQYALYFDGIDDYIELPSISGGFNWKKGVVIEADVQYEATNQNSTLLMVGNGTVSGGAGKDEIILQNMGTSGKLAFYIRAKDRQYFAETKDSVITLNKKTNIKVAMKEVVGRYESDVYIDGSNKDIDQPVPFVSSVLNPIQGVERKENYLGKSSWTEDQCFKGKIYSMKLSLTDGTVIFDYNLNK